MTYEELCKYVFSEERVAWELRTLNDRKRPLVMARQISIYLGNWFFTELTNKELSGIFNKDHASTNHAIKTIKALLFSDKNLRIRMDKYLMILRNRIKEDDQNKVVELMQNQSARDKLLETIESMELVAKVYCDLTGFKLIKND
jgi:hypothetical protein